MTTDNPVVVDTLARVRVECLHCGHRSGWLAEPHVGPVRIMCESCEQPISADLTPRAFERAERSSATLLGR